MGMFLFVLLMMAGILATYLTLYIVQWWRGGPLFWEDNDPPLYHGPRCDKCGSDHWADELDVGSHWKGR